MKMKDEYEGKTLEGAMGKASADLGIPEAELHYEVLEQGRKGLLGLGMKNVRIRVMRPVEHLTDREILNGEEPAGARVEAVAELPAPGPAEAAEGRQGGGESADKPAADEGARPRRPRRRPFTASTAFTRRCLPCPTDCYTLSGWGPGRGCPSGKSRCGRHTPSGPCS